MASSTSSSYRSPTVSLNHGPTNPSYPRGQHALLVSIVRILWELTRSLPINNDNTTILP